MSDNVPAGAGPEDSGDLTNLLVRWSQGDHSALEELTPIIYGDLLRVARVRLRREPGECTLEPTALVHEAYLRLANQKHLRAENRVHFYAIAANTMRRVLIEHARKRRAQKRGGGIRVTLQQEWMSLKSAPRILSCWMKCFQDCQKSTAGRAKP